MRHTTAMIVMGISAGAVQAEVPRVAVDIAPVHSIVSAVMEGVGAPDLLLPPGASPHGYQMRPSEARALDQADIVIWIGHSLTPWLEGPVETLGADAATLELLDLPGTRLLDVRAGAAFGAHDHDHGQSDAHDDHEEAGHDAHEHDAHGDEEHAHEKHEQHEEHAHEEHEEHADAHEEHHEEHAGHADHGSIDPHAWLDPANAAFWATGIAAILAEQDPENAATYGANADAFISDINALEAELEVLLAPVQGRPFVVFHDAYHYFEHRFDIEALGSVSAVDAAAPSAGRMAELQETVVATGAICALTEPQFNPGLLNALGPVTLGELDPLGAKLEPGPALYPALLRNMAGTLVDCLQ